MAIENTDQYRMLVSNMNWAVEENRRIEIIKSIRHLTGCSYAAASDIHAAFTNFPRDASPMPEAELRKSLSPNAPKRASEAAAEYVKRNALLDAYEHIDSKEEPTMADMTDVEKLRAWVNRDNDDEPSPLPQGTTEYLVVTRDADNNTEAFRYFNKTEAYEAAKAEHIYNTDIDVSISQVIAIVDTTPYIREV